MLKLSDKRILKILRSKLLFILPYVRSFVLSTFSVPTFKNLPDETLSKIADVLEEVGPFFSKNLKKNEIKKMQV